MKELHLRKNGKETVILVAALLLFAWWCQAAELAANPIIKSALILFRHMIHVSLAAVWIYSIRGRIPDAYLRRCLTAAGVLITFFLLLRIIKWDFLPVGSPARIVWYLYYIPMILLPCLGVTVVAFLTQGISAHRKYRQRRWIFLPAGFLITLVLTNDLHRLVFRFPEGLEHYDSLYTYGWLYYVIMLWIYGLSLYFVLGLALRSRVPGSRFSGRYSVGIMLAAIIFWFLNSLKVIHVDFVAVSCILVVVLLETTIYSGLIPSNTGYRSIFRSYMGQIWITDMQHRIRYASENAEAQTGGLLREVMEQADREPVMIEEMQLSSEAVTGGHVYWLTDISGIRKVIRRLADAEKRLQENNDLLRAEAALKEKDIQLSEQKKIFDRISEGTAEEVAELDALRKEADELFAHAGDSSAAKETMKRICFLGAYIKRYSNLILLSEDGQIPLKELELSLKESLEYLRLSVAAAEFASSIEGSAGAEAVCRILQLFSRTLYRNLSGLEAVYLTLSGKEDEISLVMEIGLSESGEWKEADAEAFYGIGGRVLTEKHGREIRLVLAIGGAGKGGVND